MRNLVLSRLREPSTAAGLAVLVSLFGVPAGMGEAVAQLIAAVAAIAAVALPERRP